MQFSLVDRVVERSEDRIVAAKHVSLAEEYLQDHFPTFPVLPGVMMIEAMVQAARNLLADRVQQPLVLGGVKALKYGAMVRPGQVLEVDVTVKNVGEDGVCDCRGVGRVYTPAAAESDESVNHETAVSGRFTMRPIQI